MNIDNITRLGVAGLCLISGSMFHNTFINPKIETSEFPETRTIEKRVVDVQELREENLEKSVLELDERGGGSEGDSYSESEEDRDSGDDLTEYARYTGDFEGWRNWVYDPNPSDGDPEPTIGVGHYLDRENSRETFEKVLPEVDYNMVYEGGLDLTDGQINRLFAEDISEYVMIAEKLFPKFNSYPLYLRQALVDGCYRGDLFDSPKTRRLINEESWEEAADEYINRRDYRDAIKNGMRGIKIRMNENRRRMLKYANSNQE